MAAKRILTQLAVDKAKPRAERYSISDGLIPGMECRVGKSGTKDYYLRYRFGGT